jgi:23S rRNA (adenine2030-N6)-methyltransferase
MNYRHAYHAGNFADVFKHVVLTLLGRYLAIKDKPFVAIDTHAGIGLYDLQSGEAERTGEYRGGIARLLEATEPPACVAPYLDLVRAANGGGPLRFYPGSPWILRALLRRGDRLDLAELHPEDAASLQGTFGGDRRVRVYPMDGYLMLKSFLPPRERRGLVLVDPPFEVPDEFERLANGLQQACRRWATGVYALWYPVKDPAGAAGFIETLSLQPNLPPTLVAELWTAPAGNSMPGLQRCGMAIVNPPWLLEEQMESCLPFLADILGGGQGGWRTLWLNRPPS